MHDVGCIELLKIKSVISRHIKNVFKEGELQMPATVANFATVQNESGREVVRNVELGFKPDYA
jgi:hypothetical protein